jgi:hypothetical protein
MVSKEYSLGAAVVFQLHHAEDVATLKSKRLVTDVGTGTGSGGEEGEGGESDGGSSS